MNDHHEESGGTPHTTPEEGHPAGDGERTDRDVGGPTDPEEAGDGDETGGAPGTKESPFEAHE
jgi:hypothetical protein